MINILYLIMGIILSVLAGWCSDENLFFAVVLIVAGFLLNYAGIAGIMR